MNFVCDQCQKAYTIADEKVAGRRFKVTCKQCGHVMALDATALRVAPPATPAARPPAPAPPPPRPSAPPAVAAPAPSPPRAPAPQTAARPPAEEVAPPRQAAPQRAAPPARAAPPPASALEHAELESTQQQDLFFASAPQDRPRHTALWMLEERKGRSRRWLAAGVVVALVAAGGAAGSLWSARGGRFPAAASTTPKPAAAPTPPPAPAPQPAPPPAAPQAEPPALAVQPELPPEPPLEQRGAAPPKPVGGQAGFEAVGSGGRPDDRREQLRKRNLSIAKKDQKLLDLLEKKGDSASAHGAVGRSELDTGRAALDEAAVRQTMAANQPAFGACVTRSVKENPKLRVDGRRATLMLTIRPSGVVTSAWVAEADLDKSPLGKCLVAAARRVVFPAFSGDPIDVSVPLALTSTY